MKEAWCAVRKQKVINRDQANIHGIVSTGVESTEYWASGGWTLLISCKLWKQQAKTAPRYADGTCFWPRLVNAALNNLRKSHKIGKGFNKPTLLRYIQAFEVFASVLMYSYDRNRRFYPPEREKERQTGKSRKEEPRLMIIQKDILCSTHRIGYIWAPYF